MAGFSPHGVDAIEMIAAVPIWVTKSVIANAAIMTAIDPEAAPAAIAKVRDKTAFAIVPWRAVGPDEFVSVMSRSLSRKS
jgi:hypothetical protein